MTYLTFRAVDQLEKHRIGDVQPGKFLQSTGWEVYLATEVGVSTVRTRHHDYWVATVVFVEAAH